MSSTWTLVSPWFLCCNREGSVQAGMSCIAVMDGGLQQNPEAQLGTGIFTGGTGGWVILFSHLFLSCVLPGFSRGWVRWTSWAGCQHWLNHSQSPWKATVPLPQCRQPAESWGPEQQRGGGIIPLFLLHLSPSSDFTGSCDLWPNPACEGTQLPWASALGR